MSFANQFMAHLTLVQAHERGDALQPIVYDLPVELDQEIASVKRAIDKLNQARNDMIEQVDDAISERLAQSGVTPAAESRTARRRCG